MLELRSSTPAERLPRKGAQLPRKAERATGAADPIASWHMLSDDMQLWLGREAMRRAAEAIAGQAEVLACEMEAGGLADRGGADALRLLASVVRVTGTDEFACAGSA